MCIKVSIGWSYNLQGAGLRLQYQGRCAEIFAVGVYHARFVGVDLEAGRALNPHRWMADVLAREYLGQD